MQKKREWKNGPINGGYLRQCWNARNRYGRKLAAGAISKPSALDGKIVAIPARCAHAPEKNDSLSPPCDKFNGKA